MTVKKTARTRHFGKIIVFQAIRPIFFAAACLLCSACFTPGNKPGIIPENRQEADLGRAAPSYVHFLESRSMLRQAPRLTAIVSGSSLPWNAPSSDSDYRTLLDHGAVWFNLNPITTAWQSNEPVLQAAVKSGLPAQLTALGVKGLYISPLSESNYTWNVTSLSSLGNDLVGYDIASLYGGEDGYVMLEEAAADNSIMLGGDVLTASTGLGPDFALAARSVRDYPGMYMLVEIPGRFWDLLPLPTHDGSLGPKSIPAETVAELSGLGLIPPAFSRSENLLPSGWASTSELVGVDGVSRRWIYRYSPTPEHPILNWDDPSGTAKRIMSASVINQAGVLHQPLVGLSLEAMWGQDPSPVEHDGVSPEPALSAIRALSREIRRYGAWSLLKDGFPTRYLPLIQQGGVDFFMDTVTSPYLEYAMLSGDTRPLKQAIDFALRNKIVQARLCRFIPDGRGINFSLGGLSAQDALAAYLGGGTEQDADVRGAWGNLLFHHENIMYATAGGLAAALAGLKPSVAAVPQKTERERKSIEQAHLLQIVFRAMQPGLLMFSGQDIEGSLFTITEFSPLPGWSMDSSGQTATKQGLQANLHAYASLAEQLRAENSFVARLREILRARDETAVAKGDLIARTEMDNPAAVGVLTKLPDGNYLLCAGNFSPEEYVAEVRLPDGLISPSEPGGDLLNSGKYVTVQEDSLRLQFAPWGYRAVLLRPVGH